MANKELKSIKFPGLADTYTVNSMPDGASANQQLTTDKDGVAKWEEKPFYQFQDTETIAWDGDTTGREEVPFGDGASFWKISDTIYPPDSIIGSIFTVMNNGVPEDIVITDETFNDFSSNIPGVWVAVYNNVPILGSGPADDRIGSSGGLYYLKTDTYYVSSSSLIKTTLKKIDLVYIPEIPAEKLPEIPAEKLPKIPAEKLPEIHAEKLPEIPAEKLPEIPAEKLPSSLFSKIPRPRTFEGSFDKVTEGRDTFRYNNQDYYKFSGFSPRREDVISFSGTRASGLVFSSIREGENCCRYGLFIVVYRAGQCRITESGITFSFNAPSAGIYAIYTSDNNNMTAGTYNFTYKTMDYVIQSSTTFKRYYLDVDNSGTLRAIEV